MSTFSKLFLQEKGAKANTESTKGNQNSPTITHLGIMWQTRQTVLPT